ncbi:MAG: RepB family plasmid replication initiator protein [Candidatus Amoebophilus sp.]
MNDHYINHPNAIIKARSELTAPEKDLIYSLFVQLNDNDPVEKTYVVYLKELQSRLKLLGIALNREQFEEATKKLVSRVYSIEEDSGDFLQVNLIASAKHIRYSDGNDLVELELSSDIRPYVFDLKNTFTVLQLGMALSLRSVHSKRLYELLSLNKDKGALHITVEKLKFILGLINPKTKEEKYKQWSIFSTRVLEVPKREIEAYTNISFTYTLKKTGRKYTDIEFTILPNSKKEAKYESGLFERAQ